ncbi:hypothetical protein FRC02_006161, partial [Tulasnella sp. 418]
LPPLKMPSEPMHQGSVPPDMEQDTSASALRMAGILMQLRLQAVAMLRRFEPKTPVLVSCGVMLLRLPKLEMVQKSKPKIR